MKRGTPFHPKMTRLARLLKISRREAVGIMEMLWHAVAQHHRRGNIGRWTDGEIADAVEWDFTGATEFVAALVEAGFLDRCARERLVVHDWAEHADKTVKQAVLRAGEKFAVAEPPAPCADLCAHEGTSAHISALPDARSQMPGVISTRAREESPPVEPSPRPIDAPDPPRVPTERPQKPEGYDEAFAAVNDWAVAARGGGLTAGQWANDGRRIGVALVGMANGPPIPIRGVPRPRLFAVAEAARVLQRKGTEFKSVQWVSSCLVSQVVEWREGVPDDTGTGLGKNAGARANGAGGSLRGAARRAARRSEEFDEGLALPIVGADDGGGDAAS